MFEEHGGVIVLRPGWSVPAAVGAMVTTRQGGIDQLPRPGPDSNGDDGEAPGNIHAECRRATALLPSLPIQWLRQVHGTDVIVAGHCDEVPRADAAVIRDRGQAAAVLTADCLPVLLADDGARVAAVVHAGWRGLCRGIVENAINNMGVTPSSLSAWLGPAIGPCHFEVGDEVRRSFLDGSAEPRSMQQAFEHGTRPGKWMADLYALASMRLTAAGVTRISGGGLCTVCDAQHFHSYRRDGSHGGRMASLIWLNPSQGTGRST